MRRTDNTAGLEVTKVLICSVAPPLPVAFPSCASTYSSGVLMSVIRLDVDMDV